MSMCATLLSVVYNVPRHTCSAHLDPTYFVDLISIDAVGILCRNRKLSHPPTNLEELTRLKIIGKPPG